jgi:cytoskeletal protein CcmA (bactofilin family)
MFKSKHRIDPSSTDTLVGEGSVFEGRIKSEAGIRVEGQVNGDIECSGDVTIGEKGLVQSNIAARNVTIAGQVTGNVVAKGKLLITTKGRLSGNINVQALMIEEGGQFQGNSRMENKAAAHKETEDAKADTHPHAVKSGFEDQAAQPIKSW